VIHYLLKGIPLGSLLILVALSRAEPPEQGPIHLNFSSAQLRGETSIWQIVQAADGQIIASGERISFYQDNRWQTLAAPKKEAIRGLLVDGSTLWVASPNELGRIRLPLKSDSQYEPLAIPALEKAGDFWSLAKSGRFLVATTADALWFIDPLAGQAQRITLSTSRRLVLFSTGDKLVAVQPGGDNWEVKEGRVVALPNPLPDSTDKFWYWGDSDYLVTSHAVYHKVAGTYRLLANIKTLNQSKIVWAARWEKYIAISTFTGGLALVDTDTGEIRSVTRATSLSTLATTTCFADREGRLWVGTSQGITVLDPLRLGHAVATKDHPVSAARTDQGLLLNYEERATYHYDDGHEESLPPAFGLTPTSHGLAIGFWNEVRIGLKTFKAGNNKADLIAEIPGGNAMAQIGDQLFELNWDRDVAELVAGSNSAFSGLVTIGDTIWGSTFDGNLYRTASGASRAFNKAGPLPNAAIATLHRLDSTLIVASKEGVYAGPNFQPVQNTLGLRNPRIAQNEDGLWMSGDQDNARRLGRLRMEGERAVWEPVEVSGLPLLSEIHSFTADGHSLVFCGDATVLELDSRELKPPAELAKPHLTFAWRDAATKALMANSAPPAHLAANNNSISFSGGVAYDEFGEKPQLERRLLPTETAWVRAPLGESISYPSLSARTYTIEVRATKLGQTGPVASYVFTVLPPWYATEAALVGYLACAAVGFYGVYRLRTHQLHRRTQELERIVKERTHALEEASAAKTEFLASMSHEIRNPMNGVLGLVDILREQPATPRQAGTLRMLHHCAEQLRSTVDDILDFSKIEAGRVGLDSTAFDLLDTLEAAAATVDPSGEKVTFLDKPSAGITLTGDVGKLRQIFANYLTNALKYGIPPGARVSTLLTPTATGVRLTLGVASLGPTIPKDTLDKFFESFTRGEQAIERNIHGTGLGLAICKRFAQAMGGEVGAVSANGETTFYLNVPFARGQTAAPASAPVHPPGMLPAKALAIEDEDYNRIVLGSILAKMNYSVDWATTGEEALRLAQENGYDIILTDYRLPDTNGVELTKKILQLCPDPKPAVFAVTAYSTKERRDECLNAGMAGFISKPITLEKLSATLASWGEKHLSKISLEASRPFVAPPPPAEPPAEVSAGWEDVKRAIATDPKLAADLAHKLNNLSRTHRLFDLAEQLELLEGALERGESTEYFVSACESFLRA
jgi:signal transduction histidine kinase/CheY-like chemotaxis protein